MRLLFLCKSQQHPKEKRIPKLDWWRWLSLLRNVTTNWFPNYLTTIDVGNALPSCDVLIAIELQTCLDEPNWVG
jgi:hypothetical protein